MFLHPVFRVGISYYRSKSEVQLMTRVMGDVAASSTSDREQGQVLARDLRKDDEAQAGAEGVVKSRQRNSGFLLQTSERRDYQHVDQSCK